MDSARLSPSTLPAPTDTPRSDTPGTRAARPVTPRSRRRIALTAAALTLTGALLAGCTGGADAASGGGADGTATSATDPAPTPVALPETPLGEQAAWVISALNGGEKPGRVEAEAPDRFTPELLAEAPAAQLAEIFTQLAAQSPWQPTALEHAPADASTAGTEQALITLTPATGDALDLQLVVDAEGRIAGLLFTPAAGDRTPAASWGELDTAVDSFAADTTLVVTEVTDGHGADPLLEAGAADPAEAHPSGSIFKLTVLAAVATAVTDGTLTWETPLTITDDVKSLPSGELQNAPSGSTVTVREAAEKMIAISDNTATDLLIATVGADAVERALDEQLGGAAAAANTPQLTTRALFQLGWGADSADGAEARDRWADGDEAERRALIAALPTGLVDVPVAAVTDPVWQHGLDWFFTPADLVAAHLALQRLAATEAGAPVREILAANPGLAGLPSERWPYVAFKGGSSVGVLAGSWYLERDDGRAFVVSIQGASADPAELADVRTFFAQVDDAVALLDAE